MSDRREREREDTLPISEDFRQSRERPTSWAGPSWPRLCVAGREWVPPGHQRLQPGSPRSGAGASGSWNKDSRLLLLSPPNSWSLPERDMLSCQSPSPRADTIHFKIVAFFNV